MKQQQQSKFGITVSWLFAAAAMAGTLHAGIIATNEDVPAGMNNTEGTESDPSIYILDDYTADFGNSKIEIGGNNAGWVQLVIRNGASLIATAANNWIGSAAVGTEVSDHCSLLVTGEGSSLTLGHTRIGSRSSHNTLTLENGATGYIGADLLLTRDSHATRVPVSNKLVVANATLTVENYIMLGYDAQHMHNAVYVREGGSLETKNRLIVSRAGSYNRVVVDGFPSVLTVRAAAGALTFGLTGNPSHNSLIVQDQGLVKFTSASAAQTFNGEDNYVRFAAGYVARRGTATTWLSSTRVQLWNGSEWEAAAANDWGGTYYADDEDGESAALDATGYEGLAGYTVFTGGKPMAQVSKGTVLFIL